MPSLLTSTSGSRRPPKLTQTVWDDLRVPLSNIQGGGTAPTFEKWRDDGAGSTGVFGWGFGTVGTPDLAFEMQMPHGYRYGSEIHAHLHMTVPDANLGDIKFDLEYTFADQDGTFPLTALVSKTMAAPGVAYYHMFFDFGVLPGVTFSEISGMFAGRIFRDNTVGGNYGSTVYALEFDLHVQLDALGSILQFSKWG